MIDWLTTYTPHILTGLAIALATVGALYRLTEPEVWPPAIRWLGAISWYLLAAVGGALLYAVTLGRHATDSGSSGGKPASGAQSDPVTTADDLEEQMDEATEAESTPSDSELVEDLNALTDDDS